MGIQVRSVWLDEEVGLRKRPPHVSAKLHGTYDGDSGVATIALIIEFNGTEYRVVRAHKEVNRTSENTPERLKYLHRNTISHFLKQYRLVDFAIVVRKFLKWSGNKTHWDVLGEFAPPSIGAESFLREFYSQQESTVTE